MITEFLGGPVIGKDSEEERQVLVGTVHGAFANCKKYLPGMFVEVDDYNILQFLEKEIFGSGLCNNKTKVNFFSECSKMQLISFHKFIIKTCFIQFLWFFRLKC